MTITRARVAHVRGIDDLELNLDRRTTMLVGRSGTGKSTVLDALSIGLAVTGQNSRSFEAHDASSSGNEPAVLIETAGGSRWRRQGLDPTRTTISSMTPEDAAAACISVSGRRARPIKPEGARTAHNPWWRAAAAARTLLDIGDAGPFDPAEGSRWSHGQAKVMELFTRIALGLWSRHGNGDDPLAGAGAVVIDDIDALLHADIQRLIIPALHRTFPGIQIIGSTHSPIVLTTIEPGQILNLGHERSRITAGYKTQP